MGEIIQHHSGPHNYLRRLSPQAYRGLAFVHWSMTVEARRSGWLDAHSHARWRETLLHTLARYDLAAPIYCLMPDHAHLLLIGLSDKSDQRRAMSFLRRYTQPMFSRSGARWQTQAYDHVLRENERKRGDNGLQATAFYILENPSRAGQITKADLWPYSGSLIVGWPELEWRMPDFWTRWWNIYDERTRAEG